MTFVHYYVFELYKPNNIHLPLWKTKRKFDSFLKYMKQTYVFITHYKLHTDRLRYLIENALMQRAVKTASVMPRQTTVFVSQPLRIEDLKRYKERVYNFVEFQKPPNNQMTNGDLMFVPKHWKTDFKIRWTHSTRICTLNNSYPIICLLKLRITLFKKQVNDSAYTCVNTTFKRDDSSFSRNLQIFLDNLQNILFLSYFQLKLWEHLVIRFNVEIDKKDACCRQRPWHYNTLWWRPGSSSGDNSTRCTS